MLRRDSATPRQYMSERFRMWDRMVLPHSVCRHQEFVKASRRESYGTHGTQVLTEPSITVALPNLIVSMGARSSLDRQFAPLSEPNSHRTHTEHVQDERCFFGQKQTCNCNASIFL